MSGGGNHDPEADQHPDANQITPGVGAAGTPAEVGILASANGEKEAEPPPIADPLEAAAQIEREEEERGEVKPINVVPEPGDVAVPADPRT